MMQSAKRSLMLRFFARMRVDWIHGATAASGWFPSFVEGPFWKKRASLLSAWPDA